MSRQQHLKTPLMQRLVATMRAAPYAGARQLLVSVSGGLDSMVLLDVLVGMRHLHRAPIAALYVHHHTGPFADISWQAVHDVCHEHGVPLLRRDFHWRGDDNFEQAAARFRRFVLQQSMAAGGYAVLAHHADDQLETFLQKLSRGMGAASMPAMAATCDRRLRPFLGLSRQWLVDHAQRAGVPHVLDPDNSNRDRFRCAVRHEVVPVLNRFHGGVAERGAAWLQSQQQLLTALRADARQRVTANLNGDVLARQVFRDAPPYLWSFLLQAYWEALGQVAPSRQDDERLCQWLAADHCGHLDLGDRRLYCDWDGLVMEPQLDARVRRAQFGEPTQWHRWSFSLHLQMSTSLPAPLVGNARDGNYQLAPNRGTPAVVKDYLRRQRIPLRLRQTLPTFVIGGQPYHFVHMLQMERAGWLRSHWLQGPDPRPHFVNLPRPTWINAASARH